MPASLAVSYFDLRSIGYGGGTWHDADLGWPITAPLEQCAELLGIDLPTVRELAARVEPYIWVDGTKVWSLTQLERQLRPEAYWPDPGWLIQVE